MTSIQTGRHDAARIRSLRSDHATMRDRDFARMLGISEAELLACYLGETASRIATDFDRVFPGLKTVGEVMVLTRNESAVHEKVGQFEKFVNGKRAGLMLGSQIDLRMFPASFCFGFAVEKADGETVRRSLQFFDAAGDAVFKVHARPETNTGAWTTLVDQLRLEDQAADLQITPSEAPSNADERTEASAETAVALKQRWEALNDPHQFHGMLKDLELHRLSAFEAIGQQWAWQLTPDAAASLLRLASAEALPIMCFVGNKGCIQIHSGPIEKVMEKGPWINVLDPNFHLHLRTDHITDVWAVRKPADIEHVTSVEAYDKDGKLVIQFFGVRQEGKAERQDWRDLVERLPQINRAAAIGAAE